MSKHKVRLAPMLKMDYRSRLSGELIDGGFANQTDELTRQFKDILGVEEGRPYIDGVAEAAEENTRKYMNLVKPVFNPLFAGPRKELFCWLFNIEKEEYDAILSYNLVYKKSTKTLEKPSKVDSASDSLIGADLFSDWALTLDIEKRKTAVLEDLIFDELGLGAGKVNKEPSAYAVCCDYYFHPSKPFPLPADAITRSLMQHEKFGKGYTLFYLLALTPEKLQAFFLKCISILPRAMRPTIDSERFDPLTAQYRDIFKANNNLRQRFNPGFSESEAIVEYRKLEKAVHGFVSTYDSKNHPKDNKQYRSIRAILASKEGHVREKMLGKRQDYSGRSVIIADPRMGVSQVGIPENMLPDLFRHHYFLSVTREEAFEFLSLSKREQIEKIKQSGILFDVPVAIGRQPTLHRLSMQAYMPIPVTGNAIHVNPLVSDAYNADFDGDQMHVSVPMTEEAIREMKFLMLSTHNIFKPADGTSVQVPRLDMLYGLYIGTREEPSGAPIGTFTASQLWDKIFDQKISVDQVVTYKDKSGRLHTSTAGRCLVFSQMPGWTDIESIVCINKKTIKGYVARLYKEKLEDYEKGLQSLCDIGFKLAQLYSPSMTLFDQIDKGFHKERMEAFEEEIRVTTEMYEAGFESEDSYRQTYAAIWKKYDDQILEELLSNLPEDNGFRLLADSGARDSRSNLMQIYSHKGLIAKSDGTAFNTVVKESFATQLSPHAHFVAAYGARWGAISKSLKPGDTGYFERMMWHSTNDIIITCDDCGTQEGMVIRRVDLAKELMKFGKAAEQLDAEVSSLIESMVVGRYEAGTDKYIDAAYAKTLSHNSEVEIRSPLKCKNLCCSKCYGKDLSIHGKAIVGMGAGVTAAHSIGEPGTQLVMKVFHTGGVAGRSMVGSVFENVSRIVTMTSMIDRETHCPIAPIGGDIREAFDTKKQGKKNLFIGSAKKPFATVPEYAVIKKSVEAGEPVREDTDHYDPDEMMQYWGVQRTLEYMATSAFLFYNTDSKVNLIHFEILAASQRIYTVFTTNNPRVKAGHSYNTVELQRLGGVRSGIYKEYAYSINRIPLRRDGVVSNILMERIPEGLVKAVLLGEEDDLENPLSSIAFGVMPKIGTFYPNYIENRLREERTLI